LCLAACAIALSWIRGGGPSGQLIEIDQASPVDYQAWIDINRADWPELTLLPGVSETMARRIVDARAAQGPFESVDDLARLPGIGPKTLARLRPYAQAN
jgi:DNA uptake protein ComE-like DNA-binding protein